MTEARLLLVDPPGRLPTVVRDPGAWWTAVAEEGAVLKWRSLNFEWWRAVASPAMVDMLLAGRRWSERLRTRVEWGACGIALEALARAAAHAMAGLRQAGVYRGVAPYTEQMTAVQDYLSALNAAQDELILDLATGATVRGLDYGNSRALLDYCSRDSLLRRSIETVVAGWEAPPGFVALRASSAQDLLTAMLAVRALKMRRPGLHASLIDHGYENFSLQPHRQRLAASGALAAIFDSIVESQDLRDATVPRLLRRAGHGALRAVGAAERVPAPPPVFAPAPILWTRISQRRCYWSRCTFCTQNNKHDTAQAPAKGEVDRAIARLQAAAAAGYQEFIFSDEALSPALLGVLSDALIAAGLRIRWACRSKLEHAHGAALFRRMREAGCYEVLFGLESISPRMQKRMGKFDARLDRTAIRGLLRAAVRAGLSVHVNLIAGFPGDTLAECEDSVDFVIDALGDRPDTTFALNAFRLFPGTAVLSDTRAYGLTVLPPTGDMPSSYRFTLCGEQGRVYREIMQNFGRLQARLCEAFGWTDPRPGARAAAAFYANSGHGAYMKARGVAPKLAEFA